MTIDVRVGAVAAIAALAGTAHADEPTPPTTTPPTTTKAVPLTTQVAIAPDDGDGAVRLSLPTEEDRAAW
ncbi:MAG TPA: hypothetical protein VGD80_37055, partial [Kofleriaceae bacterium]